MHNWCERTVIFIPLFHSRQWRSWATLLVFVSIRTTKTTPVFFFLRLCHTDSPTPFMNTTNVVITLQVNNIKMIQVKSIRYQLNSKYSLPIFANVNLSSEFFSVWYLFSCRATSFNEWPNHSGINRLILRSRHHCSPSATNSRFTFTSYDSSRWHFASYRHVRWILVTWTRTSRGSTWCPRLLHSVHSSDITRSDWFTLGIVSSCGTRRSVTKRMSAFFFCFLYIE